MNNLKINLIYLVLSLTLMACGGGGGGGGSTGNSTDPVLETSPDTTSILRGVFIDSPVEGLRYSTETLSGYTDSQGAFNYRLNETVTFSIGNLEFGSAVGAAVITPLTLTGETDLSNISSQAVNIARILQTLDDEPANQGKIKIPVALRSLDVPTSDLGSEDNLLSILNAAQDITYTHYSLVDSISAEESMVKYVNFYNNYEQLNTGSYDAEGNYTVHYGLTLPESGNVHLSASHDSGYSAIYDEYLNYVADITQAPIYLEAGTYIVNADYSSLTYASLSVTLP